MKRGGGLVGEWEQKEVEGLELQKFIIHMFKTVKELKKKQYVWLRHLKFIFSSFWRLKSLVSMSSHFLETLSLSLSPLSPPLSSVPHYPGVYQVKWLTIK